MTQLRRLTRAWRWPGAALLAVVVLIAALGGFERYHYPDNDTEVGQWVTLSRWKVRIDSCDLVTAEDGSYLGPHATIRLRAINTWHTSQLSINPDTVHITLPSGDRFGVGDQWFTFADAERSGRFDPGFERPATIVMLVDEGVSWGPSELVTIRLATEEFVPGFASDRWLGIEQAAAIQLPCPLRTDG